MLAILMLVDSCCAYCNPPVIVDDECCWYRLQVSRSSESFGRQHRVWSDIRPVLRHTNFASHEENLRSAHDQHDEERQQQEACLLGQRDAKFS